jgi:hypothetical protein
MSANKHLIRATSCTIGSKTFTEIHIYAPRPVGTGPNGAFSSPRYVANNKLPVGVTPHHVKYEAKIVVDADYAHIYDLISSSATTAIAINPCTVTELSADNKTRTVTLNNAYLESVEPINIENEAEHQYWTITIFCLAAPTFASWA